MGLLSAAFLQGAGQGLNVLGQGMLRGIERDDEQAMWEKRTKLLAEIQRDMAKTQRKDAFEFENSPETVSASIQTATTKAEAAGEVSRKQGLLNMTDPALREAQKTNADEDAAAAAQRRIDAALMELRNPELSAEQEKVAQRKLDQAKAEYKAMTPLMVERSAQTADAAAKAAAKYRDDKPTMASKIAEIEGVVGRPLSQQEREALAGLGKTDNGMDKWIRGLVDEDIKAGNITADKAPERLQQIKNGFRALEQDGAIASAVSQARKDGKASEAAAELREKGFSDEMLSKWFTKDELKKDEKQKIGGMLGRRSPSPLGTMFDHTASKIATDSYIRRTQGR